MSQSETEKRIERLNKRIALNVAPPQDQSPVPSTFSGDRRQKIVDQAIPGQVTQGQVTQSAPVGPGVTEVYRVPFGVGSAAWKAAVNQNWQRQRERAKYTNDPALNPYRSPTPEYDSRSPEGSRYRNPLAIEASLDDYEKANAQRALEQEEQYGRALSPDSTNAEIREQFSGGTIKRTPYGWYVTRGAQRVPSQTQTQPGMQAGAASVSPLAMRPVPQRLPPMPSTLSGNRRQAIANMPNMRPVPQRLPPRPSTLSGPGVRALPRVSGTPERLQGGDWFGDTTSRNRYDKAESHRVI